jgi:hypothetical protein
MGFTKALFYPTIDIHNEEWLKNAILFWDEIYTIVPSSIDNPYKEKSTEFLFSEGSLKSISVNPDLDFIDELTYDTLNYLNTNEGFQILTQGTNDFSIIHRNKLPRDVSQLFEIHPEKLPYEIHYLLKDSMTKDGFFNVDSKFVAFYMTLLANKICEQKSIGLLSDNSLISKFTDLVRLDNQIAIKGRDYDFHKYHGFRKNIHLAQGMLTNLVIKGVKINKTTSLGDILNFKRKHQDELALFRTNITKLTQNISKEISYEAFRQEVEDIYKDEFLPSYNNFKKALSGSGIKWVSDNFLKVSAISTGSTSLPLALVGLTIPQALIAGVGVSLITSLISYNVDKKEKYISNPYSYLLAVQKEFKK